MEDTIEVTRSIELEVEPDELWELISDGEHWVDWMVDTANVEVSPGATGTVTDGDEQREVRIDRVDEGERISFDWWPAGRRDRASSVELHIVPARYGTVLEIVETFPATQRLTASAATFEVARPRPVPRNVAANARRRVSRRPLDELFGALADPTRRQLLERLIHEGPHTATQLATGSAVSRQAIVKHLQALTAVDLVAAERCGREVRYRATTEPLANVVDWLRGASADWDRRAERLQRQLTS